ncbi:hypothetical protein V5799_004085 [Amblyomma americanum]|uniref:Uncharacterized protein n=1 Tax=Amblyomma americanum TaxID=6943 RepID=A0AAQ4D743_AMBAM
MMFPGAERAACAWNPFAEHRRCRLTGYRCQDEANGGSLSFVNTEDGLPNFDDTMTDSNMCLDGFASLLRPF